MKTSMRKKVILVLLIAFICRFAQDLFNPYISLDSYTNWTLWSLVILDSVMLTIGLIIGGMFFSNLKKQWKKKYHNSNNNSFCRRPCLCFRSKERFLKGVCPQHNYYYC